MSTLSGLSDKLRVIALEFLANIPEATGQISSALSRAAETGSPPSQETCNAVQTITRFSDSLDCEQVADASRPMEITLQELVNQEIGITERVRGALEQYLDAIRCAAQSSLEKLEGVSARPLREGITLESDRTLHISPSTNAEIWPRRIVIVSSHELHARAFTEQLEPLGYLVEWVKHPDLLTLPEKAFPPTVVIAHASFLDAATSNREPAWLTKCAHATLVFFGSDESMRCRLATLRAGSKAFFGWPLKVRSVVSVIDRLTGGGSLPPDRVLVIDDSPIIGGYFVDVLTTAGLIATNLTDPLLALETMREFSPDLILLDLNMPGCDGMEVIQIIRQQDEWAGIPIIVVSGEPDDRIYLNAMRIGASDFLKKPIEPDELIERVIAHIERHRSLRMQMMKDGLTGLLNHSRLKDALSVEVSRAKRGGHKLSLAIIDLDHFKSVNDGHGHQAGDAVLRNLSRMLVLRLRATDIAGRYGGEEFCILFPDAGTDEVHKIVERLRDEFSQLTHRCATSTFRVTFSAGLAELAERDCENTLFQRADAALYQAKNGGRNRLHIAA